MFLGLTGTKPKPLLEETDNCRTKLPSKLAINLPFGAFLAGQNLQMIRDGTAHWSSTSIT